mmetsp:Transcript_35564/g.49374  ORF Transcript_35564/g.49374 Transcript_35564/m.49374 type:complete len:588 (-) Transcript_35564:403-2166(-)|eukprot:CAMPEP_0196576088 /NCGR_PEP_ID=MMETSP1081-20130531/5432_1 /TAXON_ID=36882 /ORGANISM="Pyramimonas amylifera, Strain CCMP720" /LENGTH=587 /DNA_ID=CAMNT_0041894595 /DNA_START=35 /DNA_END=1798 /DNA_ORIENTATION=+
MTYSHLIDFLDTISTKHMEFIPEPALTGRDNLPDEEKWHREYLKAQGSLFKGIIREGSSDDFPKDDQEVAIHWSLRVEGEENSEGKVLSSTRTEEDGTGVPHKFMLGKHCQELYGLELGVRQMQRGEKSVLKIKPDYAYLHPKGLERKLSPPEGVSEESTLLLTVDVLDFYNVKVVDYDSALVIKGICTEGEGWETPREPFEVEAVIEGWKICGDGDEQFFPPTMLKYSVGDGQIPLGLEMGINAMCKGELAWIRCHGKFTTASETSTVKNVPTHAPDGILYKVHLIHFMQVRDLFGDGLVFKRRVQEGEGEFPSSCPINDCTVRAHYSALTLPDRRTVYDSRADSSEEVAASGVLEFPIGQGIMPDVLETTLRLMCPKEVSIVHTTAKVFYAKHRDLLPASVPEDQKMEYEVHLLGFDKAPNWYNITYEEAFKDSESQKKQGNSLFKQGNYRLAKAKYHKTACQIDGLRGLQPDQYDAIEKIKVSCHLNYAQCCLKQEEYFEAIQRLSDKLLKHGPDNTKALYRRAVGYIAVGFFDEARADLEDMKAMDPFSQKDFGFLLTKLNKEQAKAREAEKRNFGGKLKAQT